MAALRSTLGKFLCGIGQHRGAKFNMMDYHFRGQVVWYNKPQMSLRRKTLECVLDIALV